MVCLFWDTGPIVAYCFLTQPPSKAPRGSSVTDMDAHCFTMERFLPKLPEHKHLTCGFVEREITGLFRRRKRCVKALLHYFTSGQHNTSFYSSLNARDRAWLEERLKRLTKYSKIEVTNFLTDLLVVLEIRLESLYTMMIRPAHLGCHNPCLLITQKALNVYGDAKIFACAVDYGLGNSDVHFLTVNSVDFDKVKALSFPVAVPPIIYLWETSTL